jgi:hypothetical protein
MINQKGSDLPAAPSTTFVFCVESGHYEAQTLLAVECLRQFAGRFRSSPVLAITPRFGPSLTRETLRRFDELGVTYIRRNMRHPGSWYCYMNKALAVMLADEHARTDDIVWMDSDTLVVRPPDLLSLEDGADFAICSTDKNVGSSGPGDPHEPYWQQLSDFYGVDIERLPWITTEHDRARVRFRLHSGVYSYRRATRLGRAFVDAIEKMLVSRIGFSRNLPFPGDDVALAFAVVELGLNWRLLPIAYNYQTTPDSAIYQRRFLPNCHVLHYHHSATNPDGSAWLMQELQAELPAIAAWLNGRLPLNRKVGGLHRSLVRRSLAELRGYRQRQIEAECRLTVA